MSCRTRNRPQAALRRARAVELATLGCTYDSIAKQVGYRHRGTAYRAVKEALDQRTVEAVDTYRQVELDRLGAMQAALWEKAMAGNVAAVNACIKISQARSRLLGLDRPATEAKQTASKSVVISPEELHHLFDA